MVVLVHGTWGRGFFPGLNRKPKRPRWFEQGSNFRTKLAIAFDAEGLSPPMLIEHHWTGANSICAREKAAEALAALIRCLHAKRPRPRIAVIGHSHGGNVILRALGHCDGKKIRPLIITLATPFVELTTDEPSVPADNSIVEAGTMFVAMIVGIGLIWLFAPYDLEQYLTGAFLPALLIFFALRFMSQKVRDERTGRKVCELVRSTSHGPLVMSGSPLLVLRGVDDEASLTLAAGAIAMRLSHRADRLVARPLLWMLWLLSALLVGGMLPFSGAGELWDPYTITVGLTALALWALFFLTNLVVRVVPAIYGRELFLLPADVEVSSHSAPDGSGDIAIRTLSRGTSHDPRMRHGLYDEPHCTTEIAIWLKSQAKVPLRP